MTICQKRRAALSNIFFCVCVCYRHTHKLVAQVQPIDYLHKLITNDHMLHVTMIWSSLVHSHSIAIPISFLFVVQHYRRNTNKFSHIEWMVLSNYIDHNEVCKPLLVLINVLKSVVKR